MQRVEPAELEDALAGAVALVLTRWASLTPATRTAVLAHFVSVIDLVRPRGAKVIPIDRRRQ